MNSIELQIAAPTEYLTQEAGNNGAISDLYKVVNETNATKCVSIKLTAEEARLNKLDRSGVRNLVNGFLRIPQGYHGRTKNKLIVVGKSGDDDRIIEETINFVTDRVKSQFSLEKIEIAPHLQVEERKEGIRLCNIQLTEIIRILI